MSSITELVFAPSPKPVLVHVTDGMQDLEGAIVRGLRLADGTWDLDCPFTLQTDEGEFFKIAPWNCHVAVVS